MRLNDELPPEEQDWHRFRKLSQLGDHWQRPGWFSARRSYHWLLTFGYPSDLHALAEKCQEPFRKIHQFDLVSLDALHLTIRRLAFTDELFGDALPAAVTAVRQRCQRIAPFRVRIGWLAGSAGAIRFTALPAAPIVAIRDVVMMRVVNIDIPADSSAPRSEIFWPHVSIAYSNTAQAAAPVVARIEALRHLPPVEALITSLALVELRRENRAYQWEELERVALGG